MPRFVRLFDAANETIARFYDALRRGQPDQAMALWANEDFVSYIGPDGVRLAGLAQIRDGLAARLAHSVILIEPIDTAEYDTVGTVVHTATEAYRTAADDTNSVTPVNAQLIHTTYVLVHETGDWRFAHIHSSPLPPTASAQLDAILRSHPDGLH